MVKFLNLILKKLLVLDVLCRKYLIWKTIVIQKELFPLAGMAGTIQANEVIKTILNVKDNMHGKNDYF